MAEKTYYEKLKDPRWQKLRLEAMQHADFCCEVCSDDKSSLNVHHKDYIKGYEPWDYSLNQLVVLCEDCHKQSHSDIDPMRYISTLLFSDGGPRDKHRIAFIIAGYINIDFDEMINKLNYDDNGWALILYELGSKLYEIEGEWLKEIKNEN